jgi:4-hydroxymandelate oxidase
LASLSDYEAAAHEKLSEPAWAYFSGGSADEITLHRNRSALDALRLMPRVLVDVRKIDTSTELLGHRLPHPILIAPTSSHILANPEGEVATVKGAGAAGAIMVASTVSNRSIEEICAAASGPVWFQLYLQDDRALAASLISRAEAAGAKALVVTADNPFAYARNREERQRGRMPIISFGNLGMMAEPGGRIGSRRRFTWSDLDWIRSISRLPVILKGVLNPDDADEAVNRGVAAIVVSNHGGRVLDTLPATIEALPAICHRVNRRVPVLFDGGVRRGTDILKAIGIGANAILIGRPAVFGLAVNGAQGVHDVVGLLRTELEGAMAMTGRRNLTEIDQSVLWRPAELSA